LKDRTAGVDGELERRFRPRRLTTFDYTGRHAYHLVVVTANRKKVLVGDLARSVMPQLGAAATATAFELLSFVVMPDHVHILAQGLDDGSSAVRLVQRFKQTTAFHYKKETGEQLWQWSYYDHVLRREENVDEVARYIRANPVRAGLASVEGEWSYVGGIAGEVEPS
jgi:REP element-mobilizing transposase RayT